jgi:hypothetical protein
MSRIPALTGSPRFPPGIVAAAILRGLSTSEMFYIICEKQLKVTEALILWTLCRCTTQAGNNAP